VLNPRKESNAIKIFQNWPIGSAVKKIFDLRRTNDFHSLALPAKPGGLKPVEMVASQTTDQDSLLPCPAQIRLKSV